MSSFRDEAERPLLGDRPGDNSSHIDHTASPDKFSKLRAIARIVGCCVSSGCAGWHDGCIGALIPHLQQYYAGVSDETVSLVFIGQFAGYILASLLNVTLSTRLGLGRLIILGAAFQAVASAIIACRPPFLAIAMCYTIAGFGISLQDSQFNTYVARLPDASTKLGIMHSIYGAGALLSPVTATLLMQANIPPPLFYLTNLACCVVSISILLTGFGFSGSNSSDGQPQSTVDSDEGISPLRTVISSRVVWATLMFVSFYTGAESGEAGWVVSFLMRERDGGTMSGFASAAFYGGLTAGRVVLLPLTAYLSEKRAVAVYVVIALAAQVVVWVSSVFLVDFVAVAACGFVMGPVYPIAVSLVTKATPRGYHPGAVSLMACCACSGSALFPFVVGSLSEIYGIKVLQPMLVLLFVAMFLLWQLVPLPKAEMLNSLVGSKPVSAGDSADSTNTSSNSPR